MGREEGWAVRAVDTGGVGSKRFKQNKRGKWEGGGTLSPYLRSIPPCSVLTENPDGAHGYGPSYNLRLYFFINTMYDAMCLRKSFLFPSSKSLRNVLFIF